MRKVLMILLGILAFDFFSFGQISQGGKPLDFMELKSAEIPIVKMPEVNNELLLKQAIDEFSESENLKPFRFATPFDVNYTVTNSGEWLTAEDGTQVWRLTIASENAKSLNLIFENFDLPEGARLFLYDEDKAHILGAFTSYNNKASGKFAVMPVAGDEITVQYEIPEDYAREDNFEITRVNHDYYGILKSNDRRPFYPTIAGSCNVDVNCEIGADWTDIRDAVCRLFVNGTELCSGTLINNVSEDQTPYIISAAHCYDEWEYAETTIYAFNYESPYCAALDGDPSNSVSGAVMRAKFDSLDFALAEMTLVPPPEYRPYYAGWDNQGSITDTVVTIHHPWGDIKKISFDYDKPTFASFNAKYISSAFIKIARWDEGVTESGSSGGGLFNRDKNLIGTLTGGDATCSNPVRDYFARFDVAWDYSSDETKQLKHWLDPDDTGANYLDGNRFYEDEDLCGAFTNLTDEDQHQLIKMTIDADFSGYWGGTNDAGITEFVEKFSIDGAETLQGVSFGVGRVYDSGAGNSITVNVYDGTNLPEDLIYSQTVDLDFFVEDAMNYIGFEEDVQPSDNFFIGFDISALGTADTFAVYQSVRDAGEDNFFYYKNGSLWYNFAITNADNYAVTNVFEVIACNVNGEVINDSSEVEEQEVVLYPNPTSSSFTLESSSAIETEDLSVFNLLGQQIDFNYTSVEEKKIQIDLSGNVGGVYFVRFNNGTRMVSKKVSYLPW